MLRIGILLPRSTLFPLIGFDILDGIKSCLGYKQLQDDFKLMIDNIGYGTNENEIYTKVEKFLLEDNCDVIVAVADFRIDEMLAPLFTATNKLLLIVNFGANMPDKWQADPCVITHSLNFCFHTWLTGKMAGAEPTAVSAYLASYYDAGYRQTYTMITGHQSAGAQPTFTHVTPFKRDEFTLDPLQLLFEQHPRVNSLLCLFAGELVVEFYKKVPAYQRQQDLQLYVSPMLLDQTIKNISDQPLQVANVKGYAPWFAGLDNINNKTFCEALQRFCGKKANYFSLLGWETGLLLAGLLSLKDSDNKGGTDLVDQLKKNTYESPRGWLKIDAVTHHSYGPAYLLSCAGNMELNPVREHEGLEQDWQLFTSMNYPEGGSNWRNTYLCI